jgi:hypothetical protein
MENETENSTKLLNKKLMKLFLGNDKERRDLSDKLNIISPDVISILSEVSSANNIFISSYGEMYFKYVIIKKIIFKNQEFMKKLLFILAKIVHPNIQLYYGCMFKKNNSSFISTNNDNYDFYLVFEYIPSIKIKELGYLKEILTPNEIIYFKIILIDKLAQILSYLYMSNCPYLFINTKNVLLNSKLLTDKYQHLKIIYSDYNSYINNDLIKLIKIGNFLKYNKKFHLNPLDIESIDEISFHSPELIKYLINDENDMIELYENSFLEKSDIWSFGCFIFFLFFEKNPYKDINSKNELINKIIEEENFLKSQNINIENENNVIKDIIKCIKLCTYKNEDFRPCFNDIIPVIDNIKKNFYNEFLSNEKKEQMKININDYYKEFSYYQLSKYQESNIMNEEITKYKKLEEEIKISEKQIQNIKNKIIHKK